MHQLCCGAALRLSFLKYFSLYDTSELLEPREPSPPEETSWTGQVPWVSHVFTCVCVSPTNEKYCFVCHSLCDGLCSAFLTFKKYAPLLVESYVNNNQNLCVCVCVYFDNITLFVMLTLTGQKLLATNTEWVIITIDIPASKVFNGFNIQHGNEQHTIQKYI